jgi:hypothetical protein
MRDGARWGIFLPALYTTADAFNCAWRFGVL